MVSLPMFVYFCVFVVCAMIVWHVCYTGASDKAYAFGVD